MCSVAALLPANAVAGGTSAGDFRGDVMPPGPVTSATTVVERNDNGFYLVVDDQGQQRGAGSALAPVAPTDDVGVMVRAGAADGIINVHVTLENRTASVVWFPAGLTVEVPITVDGTIWRTVTLVKEAVASLRPGESVTVSAKVAAERAGLHVFAVRVEVERGTAGAATAADRV